MGSGLLRRLPPPLRRVVAPPIDALRRGWSRGRLLFAVRLHPRHVAATRRFLRDARSSHRLVAADRRRVPVAVDADALWDSMTGIGWTLHRLLAELADHPDLELRLYGPPATGRALEPSVPLPSGPALRVVSVDVPEHQSLPPGLAQRVLGRLEPGMVAASGCRALWLPNFIGPPRFSRLRAPAVATVHDLAVRFHPETLRESRRRELERGLREQVAHAAHVVTPTETVRDEVVDSGILPPQRVTALLHGPGHLAADGMGKGALPSGLRHDGFVLHVGTLEPRKNVDFLVGVWERWWREDPDAVLPLVLCGGAGWKVESLQRRIEVGCGEGWLVRPGYVDDHQLAELYAAARFSVSASIYEGFGLPLVESMAAGTPVLCSDITVYREVTDGAARLVPLDDGDAWLAAVRLLARDAAARDDLRRRGLERVGRLSWKRSADELAAILLRVAREGREGDGG